MEDQGSGAGEPLPPPAVCIAAAIFISSSVLALINIVADILLRDVVNLNFGVLVWFVGTGLLTRKRNALRWARFLFGLGWIFLLVVLGFLIARLVRGEDQLSEPLIFPQLLMVVLLSCVGAFGFWLMKRPGVVDWFEFDGESHSGVSKMIVLPIAIAALVAGIGTALSDWAFEQRLEAIYDYEVTVILEDAESGEELRTFSTGSRHAFHSEQRGFVPRMSSQSFESAGGGSGMKFKGMADAPFSIEVSSEGYDKKDVTISQENDRGEIRVPLNRVPAKE